MTLVRRETPGDIDAVRDINERAFGRSEEARLVDILRDANKAVVSLVAVEDGRPVGHIMFSPAAVEGEQSSFEALCLAPVAVLPDFQRKGIGSRLVLAGLDECRCLGYEVVVLLGHPEYYPRFGFVPAGSKGLDCEFEAPAEAWMVAELTPGALAGRRGTVKFQHEFKEFV